MELPEMNGKKQVAKLESLDNFIKKLAEKLPENSANGTPRLEIRRTSDLFDALQQALSTPPSLPESTSPAHPDNSSIPRRLIHIEIESAENLPKFQGRVSKKLRKKHKSHVRCINQDPSTFVTFEAFPSAEGSTGTKTFSTGIVEKDCNPLWNSHFSVFLHLDVQNLPLKIWRRTNGNSNQTDVQIGIATIDILSTLDDKWDIMDSSGEKVGKLTVRLFPVKETAELSMESEDSLTSDLDPALSSLIFPASTETEFGNVSFSRALKRKFTELEEISQRLKARLYDITGDANVDPDDEFEHDLNTMADEEDVPETEGPGTAYAWLGLNDDEKRKYVHTEVTKELFVDVADSSGDNDVDSLTEKRNLANNDINIIQTALAQTAITEGRTKDHEDDCQQVYDK